MRGKENKKQYLYNWLRVIISRFACSKLAVLFAGSYQVALFSFADLRRNKGFLLAESPFFHLESAKNERTA